MSSTCFERPSVHPQEDLYIQFYAISFMYKYKQSGRWQAVLGTGIKHILSTSTSHDVLQNVMPCPFCCM